MKQFLTLISLIFLASAAFGQFSVTFRVAMTADTITPNTTDGIHIAGNFQDEAGFPGEWEPSTAQMTDDNADGIYELAVTLPAGEYEYKFVNGNAWGSDEVNVSEECGIDGGSGSFNRVVTISSDTVLPAYFFNSCEISATTGIRAAALEVNFRVAPNPFSEQAVISFANPRHEQFEVAIVNLTGQVMRRYSEVSGSELIVERGDLAQGIYLATFTNEAGQRAATRLMIN